MSVYEQSGQAFEWIPLLDTNYFDINSFVGHSALFLNNRLFILSGANLNKVESKIFYFDHNFETYNVMETCGFTSRYEFSLFKFECFPSRIFVFGGANKKSNLNSIQYLDLENYRWETLNNLQFNAPSPRTAHSSASYQNSLFLFGGGDSSSRPVEDNNFYIFDAPGFIWKSFPLPLQPRQCHCMVFCGESVYIHGGLDGIQFFDQFVKVNPSKMSCHDVNAIGNAPSARAAHSAVCCNLKIFIFGGVSALGDLNDLHCYDPAINSWNEIITTGILPSPRMDFACCCFLKGNKTFIFVHGGLDSQSKIQCDGFICAVD